ncbi:DUF1697 domain-containing protein [Sphingomonas sp. BK235]|uniref:DUF1697 domain-containing protein n=1 Tax=Sphingomonas sp. BK235 TaxID=2512131 RepID=UPI001052A763|nr:DUF1697 domain-containing protein [Sphingomonas sp. BK235]TCP34888.1 uncharacterized protein (DUF1697 family) [Sphingomonas sp. BK235]
MTAYVALLRAVNVGGTGALAMAELRRLCEAAGFGSVSTYIASGNVVFTSALDAAAVRQRVEAALHDATGRRIVVTVRTAAELAEVLAASPFADEAPATTLITFLESPPAADALDTAVAPDGERIALGRREIYVAYGAGMGRSKLRLPAAAGGTARNVNTVTRLAAMAAALDDAT